MPYTQSLQETLSKRITHTMMMLGLADSAVRVPMQQDQKMDIYDTILPHIIWLGLIGKIVTHKQMLLISVPMVPILQLLQLTLEKGWLYGMLVAVLLWLQCQLEVVMCGLWIGIMIHQCLPWVHKMKISISIMVVARGLLLHSWNSLLSLEMMYSHQIFLLIANGQQQLQKVMMIYLYTRGIVTPSLRTVNNFVPLRSTWTLPTHVGCVRGT